MKMNWTSFFKRLCREDRGQAAQFLVVGLVATLGMGGLTVDVSHAYLVRNRIQAAANAAALGAVDGLYDPIASTSSTPSPKVLTLAYSFDASPAGSAALQLTNGYNYDASNGTVTTTVTTPCLNSQLVGVSSCDASNWNERSNAVRVKETASVPTSFMRYFGFSSLPITATATALPKGQTKPFNIAIILDATPSMANQDPNCPGKTEEQCGLSAVEGMLYQIYPCIQVASCTASSATNVAAVRVSFFSFPNVKTTELKYDNCASTGTPTFMKYTLPKIPPPGSTAGYEPISYDGGSTYATYQITAPSGSTSGADPDANGFSSDWWPGSTGEKMNASSLLVKVIGNTTSDANNTPTAGCLTPPAQATYDGSSYGQTYFAGAIYAAQAALQAEKAQADSLISAVLPGFSSQNVIIFVSDGQANAGASKFPSSGSTASTAGSLGVGGQSVLYAGTSTYSSTAKNLANIAGEWGQYPDINNECQQTMTAAQYAASQGTWVYAVAYGSETNGCLTSGPSGWPGRDSLTQLTVNIAPTSPLVYPALNVPISTPSTIVPCVTIENMAYPTTSTSSNFWAESSSVGCAPLANQNPVGSLAGIFDQGILASIQPAPRLIPNSLN